MPGLGKLLNLFRNAKERNASGHDQNMPCLGEKPKECFYKILLLDDTELSYELKVRKYIQPPVIVKISLFRFHKLNIPNFQFLWFPDFREIKLKMITEKSEKSAVLSQ